MTPKREPVEDVCECGVRLDVHPPLPKPKPWDHGRPCGKPATGQFASGSSFLQRNPTAVEAQRRRRAGTPERSRGVTARQLEVMAAIERGGSQSAAARLLGVSTATVSVIVKTYRRAS